MPWRHVRDLAVDLLINLWWSLKIDSNRTTWLKFMNSMNFKLLVYPYSWGYSVFWYNEAYGLPLVVTAGWRPTLQYWILKLFLLTLSVQDTSMLVLNFFFCDNCTYLWHYCHSVLVNEWPWGQLSLYQKLVPGVFPGGKGGRCIRLTTLSPSCAIVMKSGNLNFLEPSGPLQDCNGTALPLPLLVKNETTPVSSTFCQCFLLPSSFWISYSVWLKHLCWPFSNSFSCNLLSLILVNNQLDAYMLYWKLSKYIICCVDEIYCRLTINRLSYHTMGWLLIDY